MTRNARAIVFDKTGGPEVLRETVVTLPDPGPGEVLIRHEAVGLNFIDTYHRSGLYPVPLPSGLGAEAAGVIEAVGDGVTHLKPGDRAAYGAGALGAYATARVMKAATICPLPGGIGSDTAAAMMLKGLTVNYLFRRTTPIARGDTVLFHAAAGGVGLIACQWARSEGIRLIATAGSEEKCALAAAHGASEVINYRSTDWVRAVRDLTGGRGVDVVMDGVGKDTFEGSLDCLKPLGMMISFGNASGAVPPFSLGLLAAKGSLKVTRPTLFTHVADFEAGQTMARELFDKVLSGDIAIRIDQRWPLGRAAEAHAALQARETTGSTVLIP